MQSFNVLSLFEGVSMMIDAQYAASLWRKYMADIQIAASNPELLKEAYQEQKRLQEISYLSMDGGIMSHEAIADEDGEIEMIDKIAVIPLVGMMNHQPMLCGHNIDYTINLLRAASTDPNVKGIIVRTDTGGGTTIAGQRMRNAIHLAKKHNPVIQLIDGMSASAGVFAGVESDVIIAAGEMTDTGSIGVKIEYNNEALELDKVTYTSINAPESPDKGIIQRKLESGDVDYIQKHYLSPSAKSFHRQVKNNRIVPNSVLTGKMYPALEAKKLGLIDEIGTIQTAIQKINYLSQGNRLQTYRLTKQARIENNNKL